MSNRLPRSRGVDVESLGEADSRRCFAKLRNASYPHARAVESMDASGMDDTGATICHCLPERHSRLYSIVHLPLRVICSPPTTLSSSRLTRTRHWDYATILAKSWLLALEHDEFTGM
jgi:hypothetical protein